MALGAADCAVLLDATPATSTGPLEPEELSLVVWNAMKQTGVRWASELQTLTDDHDVVLLQEFALDADWQGEAYLSFAPGYRSREAQTGAAILSRTEPLARCELSAREPLLRTFKAASIVELPLANARSLVLVNLHAINFSLGLEQFRAQIRATARAVSGHRGPLVLSGDFNTWSADRLALVQEVASELGLAPVEFSEDRRLQVFGRFLDHVFVRGLEVIDATTLDEATSDHNPLFIRLRVS